MARRSCRNSALVRSYARKAGGDGSLQARFALRPTAPMFAHTRCSHIVWRAYGAAARVLTRAAPELRSPAATFTAASFRQPCAHSNRAPMATACPGAAHLTARLASQLMLRRTDGAGVPIPRQPPNPRHVLPPTAVYPRSFSRQRFSSTQRTKKRPAERWSLWQFVALIVRELCAGYSARSLRRRSSSSAS